MMKVTGGLIFKDHKLLSARRAPGGPLSGMWEFPGGKIEKGETLQGCIKRELYEELGIKAVIGDLYLNYQYKSGKIIGADFYQLIRILIQNPKNIIIFTLKILKNKFLNIITNIK